MILTAHQPVYLPWLGLFHKISLAQFFCVFDVVQYQKKDFNNRNRIKTHAGPIWLSVPVESKNHFNTKICDIKIIDNGWNRKHAKSIRLSYQASPYFGHYISPIEHLLLHKKYKYLTDLSVDMLKMFLEALGIEIPLAKASDYEFRGTKSELVLDMCRKLQATDYIFGELGRDYARVDQFVRQGISVYFQKYNHPTYTQINGEFVPYMSIVDLLFNVGPASREVIASGNAQSVSDLAGVRARSAADAS